MMSDLFATSRGSLATKLYSPSDGTIYPIKLAVFTHAWSPLGGSMHDPVLHALKLVFLSRGFHVLLYNSRTSFTGVSEAQDLKELVHEVMNKLGGQFDTVVLLGYSHGSLITSMHPVLPAPIRTFHILLSYPMSVRGLITFFHGGTYETALQHLVQNSRSNVLVVYGDHDQFTSLRRYEQWVSRLNNEAKGGLGTVLIKDGDHFWGQGAGQAMCIAVGSWLDER